MKNTFAIISDLTAQALWTLETNDFATAWVSQMFSDVNVEVTVTDKKIVYFFAAWNETINSVETLETTDLDVAVYALTSALQ